MLNLMKQRRTIRKYQSTPIPQELLHQIINSALLAPSGMNKKPIEFIVIDNKETLAQLKSCKAHGTLALDTAPIAIIIIGDTIKSSTWIEDASISTFCIQLAAETLGLASCWIQMRGRESNTGDSEEQIRNLLNIPGHLGVLAVVTLGYKDEVKAAYTDTDIDFSKVHYHNY